MFEALRRRLAEQREADAALDKALAEAAGLDNLPPLTHATLREAERSALRNLDAQLPLTRQLTRVVQDGIDIAAALRRKERGQ